MLVCCQAVDVHMPKHGISPYCNCTCPKLHNQLNDGLWIMGHDTACCACSRRLASWLLLGASYTSPCTGAACSSWLAAHLLQLHDGFVGLNHGPEQLGMLHCSAWSLLGLSIHARHHGGLHTLDPGLF